MQRILDSINKFLLTKFVQAQAYRTTMTYSYQRESKSGMTVLLGLTISATIYLLIANFIGVPLCQYVVNFWGGIIKGKQVSLGYWPAFLMFVFTSPIILAASVVTLVFSYVL